LQNPAILAEATELKPSFRNPTSRQITLNTPPALPPAATDGSCDPAPGRLPRINHLGHEARRTDFNLEELSLSDLRQLQKDLAKAISTNEDRHMAEPPTKRYGFSIAEVQSRLGLSFDRWEAVPTSVSFTTEARLHLAALPTQVGGIETLLSAG